MPNLKPYLIGAAFPLVFAGAIGSIALSFGAVNVAADTPHSDLVYGLLSTARENSIERRIHDIPVPESLQDSERIRRGAGNYSAMCANCHLIPEQKNSEIRAGLYPQPPNLAAGDSVGDTHHVEARQFWIIKHGIKASGMPAWAQGGMGDDAIWDLVAFINQLPETSKEEYQQLVDTSDGHSHAGADDHNGDMNGMKSSIESASNDDQGDHDADGHGH